MIELYQALEPVAKTHTNVIVAFSGGRDSAALLHALVNFNKNSTGRLNITAVHVNHNLQEVAQSWPAFAENFVAALAMEGLSVSLVVRDVHLELNSGESLEALARAARYNVLREVAEEQGATAILLAHHRKDQTETFLLQALRGSGVAGLAAMPGDIHRQGVSWIRPWLNTPRELIETYIEQHSVSFVDDPSNFENDYARNKLRNVVLPSLIANFPDAETTINQSAQWCAEASEALEYIAMNDLTGRKCMEGLDLNSTEDWPAWRVKNLLRYWFLQNSSLTLPVAALTRILSALTKPSNAVTYVPTRGKEGLVIQAKCVSFYTQPTLCTKQFDDRTIVLDCPQQIIEVPECNGYWTLEETKFGLKLPFHATLGARREGLQFQKGSRQPARAIKNQFQAAGVPPEKRSGPYLYAGDQLVWAPGLGLDARVTNEGGWTLCWHEGPLPSSNPASPTY